jgi:hypothetical protein
MLQITTRVVELRKAGVEGETGRGKAREGVVGAEAPQALMQEPSYGQSCSSYQPPARRVRPSPVVESDTIFVTLASPSPHVPRGAAGDTWRRISYNPPPPRAR